MPGRSPRAWARTSHAARRSPQGLQQRPQQAAQADAALRRLQWLRARAQVRPRPGPLLRGEPHVHVFAVDAGRGQVARASPVRVWRATSLVSTCSAYSPSNTWRALHNVDQLGSGDRTMSYRTCGSARHGADALSGGWCAGPAQRTSVSEGYRWSHHAGSITSSRKEQARASTGGGAPPPPAAEAPATKKERWCSSPPSRANPRSSRRASRTFSALPPSPRASASARCHRAAAAAPRPPPPAGVPTFKRARRGTPRGRREPAPAPKT